MVNTQLGKEHTTIKVILQQILLMRIVVNQKNVSIFNFYSLYKGEWYEWCFFFLIFSYFTNVIRLK
jgi:hypothetical protein